VKNFETILVLILSAAAPVWACQECIVYEISSGTARAVSMKGEPVAGAKVKLRKAIKRSGDRPHVLSCLYSFDKGRIVKSTKTDSQGQFSFRDLLPGSYWLAIRGKNAQIVRVIEVVEDSGSSRSQRNFKQQTQALQAINVMFYRLKISCESDVRAQQQSFERARLLGVP